jgi:hypothetical protein
VNCAVACRPVAGARKKNTARAILPRGADSKVLRVTEATRPGFAVHAESARSHARASRPPVFDVRVYDAGLRVHPPQTRGEKDIMRTLRTMKINTTTVALFGALTPLAFGVAACSVTPDGSAPAGDLAAATSALSDPAQDGPNGKDLTSSYSVQTLANLTQQFGNGINGGAWQLYLFQSTPGAGSRALTDDGVHIKNFWPYLYY